MSDFIIYSVEAAHIKAVVKEFGPSTKVGAIVAGQTSVKAPEKQAFEEFLPADTMICSVHSLHGPSVTTEGQPLVSKMIGDEGWPCSCARREREHSQDSSCDLLDPRGA